MPKVTSLHIYPIKSLGGISLTQAQAKTEGFQYDRRWMLVDAQGKFLTQRSDNRLARFQCRLGTDSLQIQFESAHLELPLSEHVTTTTRVSIWESSIEANEVHPQYSKWFSDLLAQPCKLVRMTAASHRPKQLLVPPHKTLLSLADGYPYLVLGSASMQTLNERCPDTIPSDRFRANILLDTSSAHEEDGYGRFKLGETTFQVIKPCARCQVITIDQQTGAMGKEPTKTLAAYRKKENHILFGANTILLKPGIVRVGDALVSA